MTANDQLTGSNDAVRIAAIISKLGQYSSRCSGEERFKILSEVFDFTEGKLAERDVEAVCNFLKTLREECVVHNTSFEVAAIIAVLRGCLRIRNHSVDWTLLRDHVKKTATKRQMRGLL